MKPARSNEYLVKTVKHEGKVGKILMPIFKFNPEHNAQKFFRFQIHEIIDTNGIDYEGIEVGDKVITKRWATLDIPGCDLSTLKKERVAINLGKNEGN